MRTTGKAQRLGLTSAVAAVAVGLTIVGCTKSVNGEPTANQEQAAAYRSEAAASSAAATSSKKAAAQKSALSDNCGKFRDRSGPAIKTFNEFVAASNQNAPDTKDKQTTASRDLRKSADDVESAVRSSGEALPGNVSAKLGDYVAAARDLAVESERFTGSAAAINRAKDRFNATLEAARKECGV